MANMSKNSFFTLFLCVFMLVADYAAAQTLQNIRFGKQGENTRIVMDINGDTTYAVNTLSQPPRIVFDLPSKVRLTQKHEQDFTGRVKDIRYGRPDGETRRIVFDLNRPAEITEHFKIAPSSTTAYTRLVIDFKDSGKVTSSQPQSHPNPNVSASNVINIKPTVLVEKRLDKNLPSPRPDTIKRGFKKQYLIILDPGHGGGDPGAIGHGNIKEKHVVLSLAKKIKARLEASGRFKVYLTRNSDHYIKLRERFRRARDMRGNLFISLHADKNPVSSVRGASVYTLSETASDKETARLARQENNAGVVAGVDLAIEEDTVANILLDLVRRETLNESKLFAEILVDTMGKKKIRRLNNTHRYAGFAVLKAPDIPSVLIEAGFMSNRHDAKLLQTDQYQADIANAIEESIHIFFDRIEYLEKQ